MVGSEKKTAGWPRSRMFPGNGSTFKKTEKLILDLKDDTGYHGTLTWNFRIGPGMDNIFQEGIYL